METEKNNKIKHRIENEIDFVNSPRYENSLKKLMEKNPDGITEDKIAKAMLMEEKEVLDTLISAISKLKLYLDK